MHDTLEFCHLGVGAPFEIACPREAIDAALLVPNLSADGHWIDSMGSCAQKRQPDLRHKSGARQMERYVDLVVDVCDALSFLLVTPELLRVAKFTIRGAVVIVYVVLNLILSGIISTTAFFFTDLLLDPGGKRNANGDFDVLFLIFWIAMFYYLDRRRMKRYNRYQDLPVT